MTPGSALIMIPGSTPPRILISFRLAYLGALTPVTRRALDAGVKPRRSAGRGSLSMNSKCGPDPEGVNT